MNSIKRHVACLDVLGFKTKLETIGTKKLATKLRDSTIAAKEQKLRIHMFELILIMASEPNGELKKSVKTQELREFKRLKQKAIFSVSIFVFSVDDTDESLHQLTRYAIVIFQIFLAEGLPIRGGIALGDSVVDPRNDIYVGTAMSEAYSLEQTLRIVAIALHESLANKVGDTTFLPLKLKCGCTKTLPVPKGPIESKTNIDKLKRSFFDFRASAGSRELDRYENSIALVSVMVSDKDDTLSENEK